MKLFVKYQESPPKNDTPPRFNEGQVDSLFRPFYYLQINLVSDLIGI